MELDYNAMSLDELKQIQKGVTKAIATYEDRQRREAAAKLEQTARDLGYSLAELAGSARKGRRAGAKRVSAPGEAKYADPNDPSQTWSGRGRRTRWMVDAMSRGMKPEDLEIGG